jgi:hypothetical protein
MITYALDPNLFSPTVSSASHESVTYGRNADLYKSDAGIGIVVLLLKQDCALRQAVMGKRKSAERQRENSR